jgi:hypothetical protein
VRVELREQGGVVRVPLRRDDAVELLGLEELTMIVEDVPDAVALGDELGRALPRLGQGDELALFAERGVAPDVRQLAHEPGADKTDPHLRAHVYQSAIAPLGCWRIGSFDGSYGCARQSSTSSSMPQPGLSDSSR